MVGGAASASTSPRSWGSWPRSGWAIRGCGCSSPGAGPRRADDGGGQALPLQPPQRRPPRARRRLRPPSLGVGEEDPVDAAVRLEVNHWNGSVEPRVVLRELYPLEERAYACRRHPACEDGSGGGASSRSSPATRADAGGLDDRGSNERAGGGDGPSAGARPAATIAELVSSGAGVLAVCADASRRAAWLGPPGALHRRRRPDRLHRCGRRALERLLARGDGGLALTDFAALERTPEMSPPSSPTSCSSIRRPRRSTRRRGREKLAAEAPPFSIRLWAEPEHGFAIAALEEPACLARRLGRRLPRRAPPSR